MRKFLFLFLFSFTIILSSCNFATAQGSAFLKAKCPSPNAKTFQTLTLQSNGNINAVPCPSGNFQINGVNVIAGSGGGTITGSGTLNFIPRFTGATAIGNTPNSWDNTNYRWDNTLLNSQYLMNFTPNAGGNFSVGDYTTTPTNYFILDQLTNSAILQTTSGDITLNSTAGSVVTGSFVSSQFSDTGSGGASAARFNFDGNSNDLFKIGDTQAVRNATLTTFDDANLRISFDNYNQVRFRQSTDAFFGLFDLNAGSFSFSNQSVTAFWDLNLAAQQLTVQTRNGATIDTGTTAFSVGDLSSTGNDTQFILDDNTKEFIFSANGSGGIFNTTEIFNFLTNRTITATGTTGNQTINKPNGSVNFAAGSSSLTVTNSVVDTNSLIIAIAQTNDATCSVKNTVASAGSFIIRMTANCTSETKVAFWITN